MHSLVELWELLALFLSKIFDQVEGSEWCGVIQLWRSGTGAETDWRLVPSPPHPPPSTTTVTSPGLWCSEAQDLPVETLSLATSNHRIHLVTYVWPRGTPHEAQLWSLGESMSVGFQKVEGFNMYTTLPPYGTLPKFLRARTETIFGRGLVLLELFIFQTCWDIPGPQNLEYFSALQNKK